MQMCSQQTLSQSRHEGAAWKRQQQLTFLAADRSWRTWNKSTVFLLLSNPKQTAFSLQSCRNTGQKPLVGTAECAPFKRTAGEITTYFLALVNEAAVERRVPVSPLQQRQHVFGVKLPPHEQVVRVQLVHVGRRGVTFHFAPLSVVGQVPRLHLSQEVHHLGVTAVPVKSSRSWKKKTQKKAKEEMPASIWFLLDAVTAQQWLNIPKMVSLKTWRDHWNVGAAWTVSTHVRQKLMAANMLINARLF